MPTKNGEREARGWSSGDGPVMVAFGPRVARADDAVVIRATETSALPTTAEPCRGPQDAFGTFGHRLSLPAALQTH